MPNYRDAASSCDVCLEPYHDEVSTRRQHALIPCGHMYCSGCALNLMNQCPECREPFFQTVRVYQNAARIVMPSQTLIDAKQNVTNVCVGLERYLQLDGNFAESIRDLLDLCAPKEEAEDRIIRVLNGIELLVLEYKQAYGKAAENEHRLNRTWKPAAEAEAALKELVISLLLDDVEVLKSRIKAYEEAFPVSADISRLPLSKRSPPVPAPKPTFGPVNPLPPGVFYYVGPTPGQGVKLGRPSRLSDTQQVSREHLRQSYWERAQEIQAEQEAKARRATAQHSMYGPVAGPFSLDADAIPQGATSLPSGDALGLESLSFAGLGLSTGIARTPSSLYPTEQVHMYHD